MSQPNDFLSRLLFELRRSLGETLGVFRQDEILVANLLADLLTKLLVSLVLITIFWAGYYLLRAGLRVLFQRFRVEGSIRQPVMIGLHYTVLIMSALVILSQFEVSATLLNSVAAAAVIAFAFFVIWTVADKLLSNVLHERGLDRSLEQLLRNVVTVVLAAFAFSTVLSQFGINVLTALAGLGIAGIAVGFAAQETLANFIAGVTLLVERPFRIGDWVDIDGTTGKVQRISLRTTRLITRDNVVVVLPNSQVATSEIRDLSSNGPLRVAIPIGIAYKESVRAAREVILSVAKAHPKVLQSREPTVLMRHLGASSVDLELLYWLEAADIDAEPRISASLLEACKEGLDQAGIEIPFPHLQLFLEQSKGLESVMARLHQRP